LVTKLYFRSTTNATSGLPTDEQSSLTMTSGKLADAVTVNRTLSETKGTTQASLVVTSNTGTTQQTGYWGRFVSDTLNMTSIPAQTWTYNCAIKQSNNAANFPANGIAVNWIHCYIWRPSNSTKIATILDNNSAGNFTEPGTANTEQTNNVTFSGASVSFATGDVIVFEVWFKWTQQTGGPYTLTWYYDGLTETATNDTNVSNHASLLSSPQTLTFGAPPSAVDTTVTGKAIATKQIIHG
jgi:hypothetical protein